MRIRNNVRRGLIYLDKRLGLREWLRQDAREESVQPQPVDPFASSEFPHPRPNTVLDVGASHGQFARDALRAFPEAVVYSFEPIPECFEELITLSESAPSVHPMNLALGDRDGHEDLWLSGFRDSSSLHQMLPKHVEVWPHTAVESKISVQVARLDAVAPNLTLRPPVFVKIDVQGHELAVIRGGRLTLSSCQRVMTECNFAPLYEGQATFTELYDELRTLGFLFDGFISPLRDPRTFELLSADAVFYKAG